MSMLDSLHLGVSMLPRFSARSSSAFPPIGVARSGPTLSTLDFEPPSVQIVQNILL